MTHIKGWTLTRPRRWAALVAFAAAGACNYDFDEFAGLGPPLLDGGSSGTAGAAGSGSGKSGAAGAGAVDGGKDGGGGSGGSASADAGGKSGASGSGGAAGSGATGGTGGAGGATGGSGATGGAAGSGGSATDASIDGEGGGGAGATGGAGTGGSGAGGAGTGGTGTGGSGAGGSGTGTGGAGTGGSGTGGSGTGGSGTGGSGTGGTGTGGAAGATMPDSGAPRDVRVDVASDRITPFDCASVGGRVYENHCYYVKSSAVTWEVASKESCVAPAHLVTITSAGEHDFVVSFLSGESRWIGLYRPSDSSKNPSSFEWVTGEMRSYTHWYASNGEPDYDGQCVRLGPSNNWGDNPCNAAFPAVCERE